MTFHDLPGGRQSVEAVAQTDVHEDQCRIERRKLLQGVLGGSEDVNSLVAQALEHGPEPHGDQRLVLDDEQGPIRGGRLTRLGRIHHASVLRTTPGMSDGSSNRCRDTQR